MYNQYPGLEADSMRCHKWQCRCTTYPSSLYRCSNVSKVLLSRSAKPTSTSWPAGTMSRAVMYSLGAQPSRTGQQSACHLNGRESGGMVAWYALVKLRNKNRLQLLELRWLQLLIMLWLVCHKSCNITAYTFGSQNNLWSHWGLWLSEPWSIKLCRTMQQLPTYHSPHSTPSATQHGTALIPHVTLGIAPCGTIDHSTSPHHSTLPQHNTAQHSTPSCSTHLYSRSYWSKMKSVTCWSEGCCR